MIKRLLLIFFMIISVPSYAGNTTTNGYFYLPSSGASGTAERNKWFNSLQATDGVITLIRAGNYWTNGVNSTLTGEQDLASANLTITGSWGIGAGKFILPKGTSFTSTDCDDASEAGRVFIKTDAPSGKKFYVCEGVNGWVLSSGSSASEAAGFSVVGSNVVLTNILSNVGIGTTVPNYKLDVSGQINSNFGMTVSGKNVCLEDGTNCLDSSFTPSTYGNATWGGGSSFAWTMDSGATKPQFTFGNGTTVLNDSSLEVGGSVSAIELENGITLDNNVGGKFGISQVGGVNNENLRVDLDAVANKAVIDSTSGLNTIDWSNINQTTTGDITADSFIGDGSALTGITAGINWSTYTEVGSLNSSDKFFIGVGTNSRTINWSDLQAILPSGGSGSGNVGIGTTGWMPYYSANGSTIKASSNIQLVGSNVGIGTSTAGSKLTVSGGIVATGTVTGSNLSGTNTGDQTTITGNAGTATALAANGSNCSSGNAPLGVDASGVSEGCFDVATQAELDAASSGAGGWTDNGAEIYTTTTTDLVGIGTTKPLVLLEAAKSDTTTYSATGSSNAAIAVRNLNTTNNNFANVAYTSVNSNNAPFTGVRTMGIFTGHTAGSESADFAITTNNAGTFRESMRILSGGNVGIGTTTPVGLLDVNRKINVFSDGNIGIGTILPSSVLDVVSANYPVTEFTRTTSGTNTVVGAIKYKAKSSSVIADGFGINFGAFIEGSGVNETQIGELAFIRDGADNSGAITFRPYASGAASERMRISSNGNVGIGTASPQALAQIEGDTKIGNGSFSNTSANEDLYVEGNLEVDGILYGNGSGLTGISGGSSQWKNGAVGINTTSPVGIGTVSPVSQLQVVGTITATAFSTSSTSAGSLVLSEASGNGTDTVTLSAPSSISTSKSWTLPVIDGSSGDVMTTNGSGTWSFASPSSGGWSDGGIFVTATTSTDNVGIGTASPDQRLKVEGSSSANVSTMVRNTSSSGLASVKVWNSANLGFEMVATGSGYAIPNTYGVLATAGESLSFGESDGTINMRINPAGTVRFTPTDTPDTCNAGTKGSLYYDNSLNELCDCDGSSWAQMDGGGAC